MLGCVCKGEAAGGACNSPRLAPMFWNGAFRAVVSVAIRTGVADLQWPAAADEAANLTIKRVDLRHVDQRHRIAPEFLRQSSDLLQAEPIVECGESEVAKAVLSCPRRYERVISRLALTAEMSAQHAL